MLKEDVNNYEKNVDKKSHYSISMCCYLWYTH